MRRRTEGLARSVHDRLKAKAEADGRPFAELLDLFGIERLLHRLGTSRHRDRFVLKGALLVRQWVGSQTRPTRDVDLMGPPGLDANNLRATIADILETRVEDDGIEFDASSIRIEPIREALPSPGYRVRFQGHLGHAVIHYQVDIVSAESVSLPDSRLKIPGLLNLPVAEIRCYTPYAVVAEKVEAIVALGDANSRMKDYYDLASLAAGLAFDGEPLVEAIRLCFSQRATAIPAAVLVGLDEAYATDGGKATMWRAFLRRSALSVTEAEFTDVVRDIRRFVLPALDAARTGEKFHKEWRPGGPWNVRRGAHGA